MREPIENTMRCDGCGADMSSKIRDVYDELEDLRTFVDNIVAKGEEQVEVDADISDKDFLEIARQAHENDRTFNEQVNIMLEKSLDKENV